MNQYTLLVFILLFSYCTVNYNSTEKQCHFLQTLQNDYQQAIENADKAEELYGYRSKAHNLALRKKYKTIKQSIHKMEEYLNLYSYPTTEQHGPDFVEIPQQILLDNGPSLQTLKRNLSHFYAGFKNGDLPDWVYVRYMQKMYQHQYGDILRLENPYTTQMQLDTLQKILKINEEILEVRN